MATRTAGRETSAAPERRRPVPAVPAPSATGGPVRNGALAELHIHGLGAIDDVTLELAPGLTVVTGETGAGKTMVGTGLTLLFGGRPAPGRVGAGGRAGVEG